MIQRELETVLARSILKGYFEEGDSVFVSVKIGQEALSFHRVPPGGQVPGDEAKEVNGAQNTTAAVKEATATIKEAVPPMQEIVAAAPRTLKFDPLKGLSRAAQAGEDLTKDGSKARSDPSSLTPSAN